MSIERLDYLVYSSHRSVLPQYSFVCVVGAGAPPAVPNSWRTGIGRIDDIRNPTATLVFATRSQTRGGIPKTLRVLTRRRMSPTSYRVVRSRPTQTASSVLEEQARSLSGLTLWTKRCSCWAKRYSCWAKRCSCGTIVAGPYSVAHCQDAEPIVPPAT